MTTSTREDSADMGFSDAELITAVRAGDLEAYGALFERHSQAAHRLARQLVRSTDSDDLVAESFTRVLATLQNGKGPDESFRAYLLTAMRRMHVDRVKAAQRVRVTDDESELDRHVEWIDPSEMRFEQTAAAQAFGSLPERWQMVLWHLDVEGQKPGDIAPLLAMSANSVSALAYRAREGLRQAYLQGHLSPEQSAECRATTSMLGAHVRGGLSSRDTGKVEAHLDTCARCMGLSLELDEVNQHLSGLLGPALLGAAASGYLAAGTGVVAGVGGAIAAAKSLVAGGAEAVFAPFKSASAAALASGPQGAIVAAVTVAAVATGAVAATGGFAGPGRPVEVATITSTRPSPTVAPPTADAPAPTVITPTTAAPTPTPAPSPALADPTVPPAEPATTVRPRPAPAPATSSPPTAQPTDYAVARVSVKNESAELQRSISASISASNPGFAQAQPVSVTFAFARAVEFRGGVTGGWSCGNAAKGEQVSVVICRRTLAALRGGTVSISVAGTTPHGTVTVSSSGDPQPANDRQAFLAPVW